MHGDYGALDPKSFCQAQIPHLHHLIHKERVWQLNVEVALAPAGVQTMLIQVPAGIEMHLDNYYLYGDRDARFDLYMNTVPDTPVGGAPFAFGADIWNKYTGSAIAPQTVIIDGPSLVGAWVIGNMCDLALIDVTAWGQTRLADDFNGTSEWVFDPLTDHAMTITNLDGADPLAATFKMLWYEVVEV